VSGVVVTKLDGTARAGYVVAMTRDLGLPVKLVGVGEKIDDLRDFEPPSFVDALLGNDEASSQALQERLDANLAFAERNKQLRADAEAEKKKQKGSGGSLFGDFGGGTGSSADGFPLAPPSTTGNSEPMELVMMGDSEGEEASSGFGSGGVAGGALKRRKNTPNKKNKKKKKNTRK
jgi:hypothetical protein